MNKIIPPEIEKPAKIKRLEAELLALQAEVEELERRSKLPGAAQEVKRMHDDAEIRLLTALKRLQKAKRNFGTKIG